MEEKSDFKDNPLVNRRVSASTPDTVRDALNKPSKVIWGICAFIYAVAGIVMALGEDALNAQLLIGGAFLSAFIVVSLASLFVVSLVHYVAIRSGKVSSVLFSLLLVLGGLGFCLPYLVKFLRGYMG